MKGFKSWNMKTLQIIYFLCFIQNVDSFKIEICKVLLNETISKSFWYLLQNCCRVWCHNTHHNDTRQSTKNVTPTTPLLTINLSITLQTVFKQSVVLLNVEAPHVCIFCQKTPFGRNLEQQQKMWKLRDALYFLPCLLYQLSLNGMKKVFENEMTSFSTKRCRK